MDPNANQSMDKSMTTNDNFPIPKGKPSFGGYYNTGLVSEEEDAGLLSKDKQKYLLTQ